MLIRKATQTDAEAICGIYNRYIEQSRVTFETEPLSLSEMQKRVTSISTSYPYLVGEQQGELTGYAYLCQFRSRCAYAHVAESSIYIAPQHQGAGWGRRLYQALIEQAPDYGISEIVGVIALPNPASERLHQSLNFKPVGTLERMGYKFGDYIDTAYWQLSLPAQREHTPC